MRIPSPYILACLLLAAVALAATPYAPQRAETHIRKALEDLQAGRYDQAEQTALEAARLDEPARRRGWIIVAFARQQRGQFADASVAYREFLGSCQSPSMRDYVLAQMRLCQTAVSAPASVEAPSRLLSPDDLAALAVVEKDFQVETTEHFVVKAHNARLAKLVAGQAEASLQRICGAVLGGQEYPHTVEIRVWGDRGEFLRNAQDAPEWAGGSFRLARRNGLLTRAIDLTQLDDSGRFNAVILDQVLPHEMCHLVVHEYFGDAACPLFLDEGLAMLAESRVDNQRLRLAGAALAGQARIPMTQLLGAERQDVGEPALFYAEAFSLTEFLHERLTPRQFQDFLGHLKAGCCVADALQRALYVAPREDFPAVLARAWEDYAVAQGQYLQALQYAGADLPPPAPVVGTTANR